MRSDMAKVIVERPRLGSRQRGKPKGYRRRLRRLADDGPPRHEGMKRRWAGNTKWLNEHLGPLRRYLDSQVGRPWDKVFSEICAHIDRSSAVQDHVRDHVDDYVTVNVVLIDGVACNGEGGYWHGTPLSELAYRASWYVCPRTGVLRRIRPRRRAKKPAPPPVRFIPMGKDLQCRRINGVWHLVTLGPLPPEIKRTSLHELDILLNKPMAMITDTVAREQYGALVYAVGVRRLAKKELSQFPIPREEW